MLRNRCVNCDYVIEAAEDQRGGEVVCPSCEATNVLRSEDDLIDDQRQVLLERERFLRALARKRSSRLARQQGDSGAFPVPVEQLASPMAGVATRQLKDISVYLLVVAYLFPPLALAPALVIALWGNLSGVWAAFAFLTGSFAGVLAFIFFKFMSDTVRALASVSEMARSVDARLTALTEPYVIYEDTSDEGSADASVLSEQSS